MPRAILFVLLALSLSACSRIKVGYRFAGFLIEAQARKYLKLHPEQDKQLEADVERYMDWHREVMLPEYAQGLEQLAREVSAGQGEAAADSAGPLLTQLYRRTVEPMVAPTAKLLLMLDRKQLEDLEGNFARKQREDKAKYLDKPAESAERRLKRTVDFIEDWAGKLSKEQVAQIAGLNRELKPATSGWLTQRGKMQGELLGMLRGPRHQAELEKLLREWWTASRLGTKEEQEKGKLDEAELRAYTKKVLAVLTPQQRGSIAGKLRGMAEDCRDLAVEPRPAPKPTPAATSR